MESTSTPEVESTATVSPTSLTWAPVFPNVWARRLMNAAICSRVTLSPGQNSSLVGGLQPRVTSLSANQVIEPWNVFESGTSVNRSLAMTVNGTATTRVKMTTLSRRRRRGVVMDGCDISPPYEIVMSRERSLPVRT